MLFTIISLSYLHSSLQIGFSSFSLSYLHSILQTSFSSFSLTSPSFPSYNIFLNWPMSCSFHSVCVEYNYLVESKFQKRINGYRTLWVVLFFSGLFVTWPITSFLTVFPNQRCGKSFLLWIPLGNLTHCEKHATNKNYVITFLNKQWYHSEDCKDDRKKMTKIDLVRWSNSC